ncbi:MAG TPA: hypothetical protein VM305_09350 [Candidatus Limnocylindrales bacterium]|nr:hypothetical protein [Candidatus Limnocylindrales bacterium]
MTQPRDRTTVDQTRHDDVRGTDVRRDEPRTTVLGRDDAVAAPPTTRTSVVETVEPVNRPLTWGPIWAGVVTAFGLFVLFSLLALAGGLAVVEFGEPGAGVGQDAPVDLIATILTGLLLVLGFFAGGFVASWSAWETDQGRGILNGFLVWALALLLLLAFAAFGLGQWFGAAGQVFGGQFQPGALPDVDPQQLGDAFEDAAWQSVFAIVLAMTAAVLGGLVGTRDEFHDRFPYLRSAR